MGKGRGPYLPAINPYTQDAYAAAGLQVNPKSGRVSVAPKNGLKCTKEDIQRQLTLVDRQDFVNRITWYNWPSGLNSQMVENMIYHKGDLCFFYSKELNRFFLLPYALEGGLDVYGRFVTVHPIPLTGTTEPDDKTDNKPDLLTSWLADKHLRVLYEPVLPEDVIKDPSIMEDCCVLLHDYTPGLSQTVIPRAQLNRGLIDLESDMLPFLRTALLNSTGVRGVRVNTSDEAQEVDVASQSINDAALHGEKYVPIVGGLEFQDLTDGTVGKSEEFLLSMQSIDNLRLSTLGIQNGGLFQKKQSITDQQASVNGGTPSMTLNDCVSQRQLFCDIVNSVWWFLDLACESSEAAVGIDKNMDGEIMQEQDQSGVPGDQPQQSQATEGGSEE